MSGKMGAGFGTGLGQSWAGIKRAWLNGDMWGSFVTGFTRLGGEISDGSIWLLDPLFWPLLAGGTGPAFFKMGGKLGNGLERREEATAATGSFGTMVSVSEEDVL
jgi:hypothetical protein